MQNFNKHIMVRDGEEIKEISTYKQLLGKSVVFINYSIEYTAPSLMSDEKMPIKKTYEN